MEKLKVSIYNELLILEKYRLTPEEWFVTQLLFLGSSDERDPDNLIFRLYKDGGLATVPLRDMLTSLQSKGILCKTYKIPQPYTEFDPEGVIFNKNFLKSHFKFSSELGEDLYTHYPTHYGQFRINFFSKFWISPEEMGRAYGKAIKWDPKKHEEVLEILEWAKDNNLITFGIAEFIISRQWVSLAKMRDEGICGEMFIMEEI